jgi:hydroxymethylglutaryl-CoA lyase
MRISINEVVTRDGFQNEPAFIPTAQKIEFINGLSQTGVAKIEVTSFVSAKSIPALADAEAVMRGITRCCGIRYTALVPNLRGAERALASGVDEINLIMSLSETHNLANLRMSREQSAAALGEAASLARAAAVPVNISLSCAFGCPMEGDLPAPTLERWVSRLVDLGIQGITLCDTTGMAHPTQVDALVRAFRHRWPTTELTLHFHDTRGMGAVNVWAAAQVGGDRFDASLGGLGGCPYAPGASGNVCTEDIVHMLNLGGYETGVNLEALLECSHRLATIVGHDTPGQVCKAGPRSTLHPPPHGLQKMIERAAAGTN